MGIIVPMLLKDHPGRFRLPFLTVLLAVGLAACAQLPVNPGSAPSHAVADTGQTALGRAVAPRVAAHPGLTGVQPLTDGAEALFARLALAAAAERTLDAQYYSWQDDITGKAVLLSLLEAADRGVRVRLLLDDIHSGEIESMLELLDRHPQFEVRLFNPFADRQFRIVDYFTRFRRVNRRMHNKSFIADNQVAILGGRNIGDSYFEVRADLNFGDIDVVTIGEAVRDVSRAFDRYWNSPLALPLALFPRPRATDGEIERLRKRLADFRRRAFGADYAAHLHQSSRQWRSAESTAYYYWGEAKALYDHPHKALAEALDGDDYLMSHLQPVLKAVEHELIIITPYFVPGRRGVRLFKKLAARGVRIRVLTNSLAATDVGMVHSAYARYRKKLLRIGVELYEAKPTVELGEVLRKKKKSASASAASLHAKSFVFDRRALFIGSLNLDPRSIKINTEIGLLIESPEMAREMAQWFDDHVAEVAYRLELRRRGSKHSRQQVEWLEATGSEHVRYLKEPHTSLWRRFQIGLLSLLPLESQL